jgi:hypothetical protein
MRVLIIKNMGKIEKREVPCVQDLRTHFEVLE